jgi:hypothetical protein
MAKESKSASRTVSSLRSQRSMDGGIAIERKQHLVNSVYPFFLALGGVEATIMRLRLVRPLNGSWMGNI